MPALTPVCDILHQLITGEDNHGAGEDLTLSPQTWHQMRHEEVFPPCRLPPLPLCHFTLSTHDPRPNPRPRRHHPFPRPCHTRLSCVTDEEQNGFVASGCFIVLKPEKVTSEVLFAIAFSHALSFLRVFA
jgi:hypothetical protein